MTHSAVPPTRLIDPTTRASGRPTASPLVRRWLLFKDWTTHRGYVPVRPLVIRQLHAVVVSDRSGVGGALSASAGPDTADRREWRA